MMPLLFALTLTTTTFTANATVPKKMVATDCGGANVSPQLRWSGVPAAAKSLVLIVHDPDAPHAHGYYHWVLVNLPPEPGMLAENAGRGYYGPCPPPGKVHHYHFTLYALDEASVTFTSTWNNGAGQLQANQLQESLRGHILAQATLIGLWSSSSE
jgi:phosphatidylethanolamine-binding protein (PEBP) family uncharacterized protein